MWPLSAHLAYLFTDRPLPERVAAARHAGFDAVEHPSPFEIDAETMTRLLRDEGLSFTQLTIGFGDQSKGEKGIGTIPGREADLRESMQVSLDYAEAVGCGLVHMMAGPAGGGAEDGAGRDRAWKTYRANLELVAEQARKRNLRVLVEPISASGIPGYLLDNVEDAMAVSDAVDPRTVFILLDTFHAAASGLDAPAFIRANAARIGHVHIADHPGRHEPGTGAIDFDAVRTALRDSSWQGALGFEYKPRAGTEDGMGWLAGWKEAG